MPSPARPARYSLYHATPPNQALKRFGFGVATPDKVASRFELWDINGLFYAFALVGDSVIGVWGPESTAPETPYAEDVLAHRYAEDLVFEAQILHDGKPVPGVQHASNVRSYDEADVYSLRQQRAFNHRLYWNRMFLPVLVLWGIAALFVIGILRALF